MFAALLFHFTERKYVQCAVRYWFQLDGCMSGFLYLQLAGWFN